MEPSLPVNKPPAKPMIANRIFDRMCRSRHLAANSSDEMMRTSNKRNALVEKRPNPPRFVLLVTKKPIKATSPIINSAKSSQASLSMLCSTPVAGFAPHTPRRDAAPEACPPLALGRPRLASIAARRLARPPYAPRVCEPCYVPYYVSHFLTSGSTLTFLSPV